MLNYHLYKFFFFLKKYNFEKGVLDYNNFQRLPYIDKKKYQDRKIEDLLSRAFANNAFYKFHKNSSFIDLPIITKKDMMQNENYFSKDEKIYKFASTSGSTGIPLVFPRSIEAFINSQLSYFCFLKDFGVNRFDQNIYIGGVREKNFNYNIKSKINSFLFAQKKYSAYDFFDNDMVVELVGAINSKKFNLSYISGFSQSLYQISKKINSLNLKITKNLKLVHPNAEAISAEQKEIISQAFNVKTIPMVYGSTECHIASECSKGIMHVNMKNCFIEIINDEIVLTVFDSYAHPFIRYKIGDYGQIQRKFKCKCGIESDIFLSLDGRSSDNLFFENKIISHPMVNMLMQQIDNAKNIIAYQIKNTGDLLVINVHTNDIKFDVVNFKNRFMKALNLKKCTIVLNEPFIHLKNGKRPVIINEKN